MSQAHGTSRNNGEINVMVPPPHDNYYLPGGDLYIIVGAFDRFQLTMFHSNYFVTFDRIGRGYPFPCPRLFFFPRFADISVETQPCLSGPIQGGYDGFSCRVGGDYSEGIRNSSLGVL